jgi:hypothetical protein
MNNLIQEINSWLHDGAAPTMQRVEELAELYPCFALPAVMLLRNGAATLTDEQRHQLTSNLAIMAPDIEAMNLATNTDLLAEVEGFYPSEAVETPSTDSAITKFIDNYGNADPHEEEMLTKLIFNPTPDYAQVLAREEEKSTPQPDEAEAGSPDDRINQFIIKSKEAGGDLPLPPAEPKPEPVETKPKEPPSPVQKPEATEDTLLSESLAQIYIRRGRYAKAYEIISNLNLNFPEKSIYFADQLRFLSQLMAIEERKTMLNNKQQ